MNKTLRDACRAALLLAALAILMPVLSAAIARIDRADRVIPFDPNGQHQ